MRLSASLERGQIESNGGSLANSSEAEGHRPPAPVLVLGNLRRVVVPVARNLHARGLTVHVASVVSRQRIRSRAIRSFTIIAPAGSPAQFREELLATIERLGIGSILPTGDDILERLAPLYEEIKDRVTMCCPTPEIYGQVLRKETTLAVARKLGIPAPLTYNVPSLESLEAQRDTMSFPVFAKAGAKAHHRATGIRARIFDSYEELRSVFEQFPLFGKWFLIQEFVPGGGVGLDILMWGSEPAIVFQHRRVRELPFTGGVSVAAESEPVDPELAGYAVALLRALGWSGVAMVEFRRDRASGRAALMEVNGRFWGSVALSIQAGLEFPYHAWAAAHGLAPERGGTPYRRARFRWLLGDTRRLLDVMRLALRRRVSLAWTARQIAAYLRDFFPPVRDALWSWSDPRAALHEAGEIFNISVVTYAGRVAHWMLPPHWLRKIKRSAAK